MLSDDAAARTKDAEFFDPESNRSVEALAAAAEILQRSDLAGDQMVQEVAIARAVARTPSH